MYRVRVLISTPNGTKHGYYERHSVTVQGARDTNHAIQLVRSHLGSWKVLEVEEVSRLPTDARVIGSTLVGRQTIPKEPRK